MGLVVGVVAGVSAIGVVLISLGLGLEIARAPRSRIAPVTAAVVLVGLILGAGTGLVAFAAYNHMGNVAVVTVPDRSQVGVAQSAVPQPAQDAWLHFRGDDRDYIAGGVPKVWTITESNFTARGTRRDIQVFVSGRGDDWHLEFRAPSNGDLHTGVYANAERAPFVTGKAPGLDVFGDGRGCNTLSGRFSILTLVWTRDATVAEMDIAFEQHCEEGAAALRGELWFTTERGLHRAPPAVDSAVSV